MLIRQRSRKLLPTSKQPVRHTSIALSCRITGRHITDIEPILELHPKTAVIAVNPANRYRHPSAPILRELIDRLGAQNVVFTGSEGRLDFDSDGVQNATFTAAQRDSYALFIEPSRRWAEQHGKIKEVADYEYIRQVMFRDSGTAVSARSRTEPWIEQKAESIGSTLSPEFEIGSLRNGGMSSGSLIEDRIFAATVSDSDRDVVATVERDSYDDEGGNKSISAEEAQQVLDRLEIRGTEAQPAQVVKVSMETTAGVPNGLEPSIDVQPGDLTKLATAPKLAGTRTHSPTPPGGMVFLAGGKLFISGNGAVLVGGTVDVCGQNLCIRSLETSTLPYVLPFETNSLFSEVWDRVYNRNINTFYLSINPTKKFLSNTSVDNLPSDRLMYGTSANPDAANEVVTAGDIQGTDIGCILWQSDVAFKSASLGFDVLQPASGLRAPKRRSL